MLLMLRPLKHYVDFAGRSRAAEIWAFQLGQITVVAMIYVLFATLVGFEQGAGTGKPVLAVQIFMALISVPALSAIIPFIALLVRRFHDQAMSGWFLLLYFVPYLGSLILLFFMCRPGTKGPNRYGPDPRDELTKP